MIKLMGLEIKISTTVLIVFNKVYFKSVKDSKAK